jgi:uncharacterized LabA/DUF88 family protein
MGTAWFVDGSYALNAWNSVRANGRMDYLLLRNKIEADAKETIGDAYYFDCESDSPYAAQQAFHSFLRTPAPAGPGLRVKLYWLQTKFHQWPYSMGGGPVLHPTSGEQYVTKAQKAVDVGMAFHLMRSYSMQHWDKLYLVAGDGDFHEVIQHLVENEAVDVTVIGARGSISGEIAPFVRIIEFSDMAADIIRRAAQ